MLAPPPRKPVPLSTRSGSAVFWSVVFLLGAGGLTFLGAKNNRNEWVVFGLLVGFVGVVIALLVRRASRQAAAIYTDGREVPAELAKVTTVMRRRLVVGWVAELRVHVDEGAPRTVVFKGLDFDPSQRPVSVLVKGSRVALYAPAPASRKTALYAWTTVD